MFYKGNEIRAPLISAILSSLLSQIIQHFHLEDTSTINNVVEHVGWHGERAADILEEGMPIQCDRRLLSSIIESLP
jgi:hypothetical protein